MNYATTIERISPDSLSRVEYRYWQRDEMRMELDWVVHQTRPTKRHGWRLEKRWSRLQSRDNNMAREEPPQDVKDELRQKINDALSFC